MTKRGGNDKEDERMSKRVRTTTEKEWGCII
jgi:hypothetical protein